MTKIVIRDIEPNPKRTFEENLKYPNFVDKEVEKIRIVLNYIKEKPYSLEIYTKGDKIPLVI